ncbi:MAG TPA: efflux RND transporter permease subunit [Polyangiales bacterium]|nr:efflux RND transporter permease subunit [Polyangiales bacterium]
MLAEFAVRRWQFTLVVFIALIALGVNALFRIPKAEDPTFPLATFLVVAVLPGSSPADLERLVVDPTETKLKALDDVKHMKTEIEDGLAVIQLEFESGVDADRKRDDVLRETTALRPTLPAELLRLDVLQFNAALVKIVEVALTSPTASFYTLDRHARALKRRLEGLAGVHEVEIAGLPKQEVAVSLDLPRMAALGISPVEVIQAIRSESANLPAGSLDAGARRFNVKTSGDYGSVDEIRDTVVRSVNNASVRVGDIAEVELRDAEFRQITRFNGKRAVLVAAAQKEGQNIFEVAQRIQAELAAFEPTLPAGVRLERGFEQIRNVSNRLGSFARDFGLAIALVLVTLLPLGTRASLVVMVSIPLSLALGLLMLHLTGFSINQLSIVGFVIALGLLVDDSVVVVENITRHLREGLAPRAAAVAATREITASVIGCTATLIFAFLPLLALPGNAGQFIRSMPLAIVFTIAASLLVSLTIVPFLASVVLKPDGEHGNIFLRALKFVIEGSYRRVLNAAIARPWIALVAAVLLFVGSLSLIPRIGFSLFPKAGTPQFLVQIETAEGASLSETDRAARFVEGVLAKHPEIERVATSVGKGHPRIYYNVSPKDEKANVADVFALVKVREREKLSRLYASLRSELNNFAGAKIELREFENGPPLDAPVALRLLGDDQAALMTAAARVEKVMLETGGTRDVRNPSRERRTDLRVQVDREKAALLGVQVADMDQAVRLALGGVIAGKYREDTAEDAYDVRVTLPRTPREGIVGLSPGLDALDNLYVANRAGNPLPLSQVAQLELEPSPAKLRHYNKERSITVTSYVRDGFNTDRVTKAILGKLANVELPAGVRLVPAGEIESRKESFGGLGLALLVAAFGVLSILVLEFRTFKSTLIVASVIPLGVIGGLVALYLSGNTLSFTANIGFIALMGIEVKNSILLVDFTNQLRERGVALDEAIQRAGEARFIPILLTTLTAIGGLIPLVLENSTLYSPLALVILGGLISSTLLTRIVTPVLYKLLAPEVHVLNPPVAEPEPAVTPAPAT